MRKTSDERRGFAAAYREGLGLVAVAVVCGPDGTRIAALPEGGEGPAGAVQTVRARWWCRRAAEAERVAAAAARMLRRESSDAALACKAVTAAARRLDVALHADQDVADEAMHVAARVDAQLRSQHEAGDLKSVNRAYRTYRLERSARGERVLRYDEWMQEYRENLVRHVASALR